MKNIYLLKDLAAKSGHSIHTIKYYLKIGLIHEAGRFPNTNFRFFDDETVKTLETIRELRRERTSIKAIDRIINTKQGRL